ncbi:MAG: hypothetical protein L7F78_08480 [Syntrophales bacterium LBB04]|nr:hypothetical protein [Syntrophales bacterium LBB04]
MVRLLDLCSGIYNNMRRGEVVVRLIILLLSTIILVINLSGCNTVYRNYIDQKVDSAAEVEKARATRGSINVILLPGCATKPGAQDTLFSCLKLSRDVNPESVKLPPDEKLYLGHVAEFILRALKYYQLEESFKDFYGCRIVLKFRKLTPQELRSRKFADYSSFAVGTASTVAGVATLMPLGIFLFLVDGIKTEFDRQDFEDRVAKMGLPTPTKNIVTHKLESGGRTLLYVKDEIAQELTGKTSEMIQFDDKITSYMVEECLLEKVTPEEMNLYQEQINLFKKYGKL